MAGAALPTTQQEQDLHRRLLAGDKLAMSDLAQAYYEPLLAYLRGRNARHVAQDLLADAASQAWEALCKDPRAFDGTGSLWKYLQMSAQGDLRNLLAKEQRRHDKHSGAAVEHLPADGRNGVDEIVAEREEAAWARTEIVAVVRVGLSDAEIECLELYLAGEKKTASYARVLDIVRLPAAEQRARVYRVKDKLARRLGRARRKHDEAT
jgi:hypothetical protein